MTTPRKTYSAAFKAQIVQELLKEEQTLAQIASKHGVHPTQLRNWRASALKAMPDNFDDEERYQKRLAQLTEENENENEIGKLSTQLTWLKKKAASCGIQTESDETGRTRR
jgi:transposase-like protein